MEKLLSVGTTFSGIGAPEQALKNLGIPHVVKWACDNDKRAREAYHLNHDCEMWYNDITTINPTELEPVDLYIFGFPCQDVSVCGKQKLNGRTTLVEHSLNIIDEINPKFILFENVKGLLNQKFATFYKSIVDRLSENYNMDIRVLNSKHFGTPQNRERVFGLGTRKDLWKVELPQQDKTSITPLQTILEPSVGDEYTLTDHKWQTLQAHKERHTINGNGLGYRFLTDRAFTLLTTYYPLPHQLLEQDGKNPRFLTERECARLQGFPDSFKLHPVIRQAYKQLGNTMTLPVIEAILKPIGDYFTTDNGQS